MMFQPSLIHTVLHWLMQHRNKGLQELIHVLNPFPFVSLFLAHSCAVSIRSTNLMSRRYLAKVYKTAFFSWNPTRARGATASDISAAMQVGNCFWMRAISCSFRSVCWVSGCSLPSLRDPSSALVLNLWPMKQYIFLPQKKSIRHTKGNMLQSLRMDWKSHLTCQASSPPEACARDATWKGFFGTICLKFEASNPQMPRTSSTEKVTMPRNGNIHACIYRYKCICQNVNAWTYT